MSIKDEITEVLVEHALYLIEPLGEDLDCAWAAECDCDATSMPAEDFQSAARAHAAHQADKVLAVIVAARGLS